MYGFSCFYVKKCYYDQESKEIPQELLPSQTADRLTAPCNPSLL